MPSLIEPELFAMNRLLSLPLFFLAAVALPAAAQMLPDRLSLHPEHIAADADFLIKIEDYWPNGCGGELSVDVQTDVIRILARSAQAPGPIACTEALLPFTRLINPRDHAPQGLRWADLVKVEYRLDTGTGPELRESESFAPSDEPNPPAAVETGTWSTPLLANAAMFIDQQESLLTAALFDYDSEGRASWHYAGAMLNGNVYIAPMQRYGEVECVTTPCPRALPVETGGVRMLIDARSRMWVEFDDVLADAPSAGAIEYNRLDFQRSPELVNAELPAPDLVGRWVGGVAATFSARGEPLPAALGQWDVVYGGYDNLSGTPRVFYHAYPAPLMTADGRPPSQPLAWRVECVDLRPVDGPLHCAIANYPHPQGDCMVSFEFEAAGHSQVNAKADCGVPSASFGADFNLFRLPPGS
jgi:hypothetical protein